MYAVIETGGKQYRVQEGSVVKVEKLDVGEGEPVEFDRVLMIRSDSGTVVGSPYVEGAKVQAKVLQTAKSRKVLVFKMKPRKGYRRLKGHRQYYTKVLIEKISSGGK